MAAEIDEYDVFPVEYLRSHVKEFECYAVNEADFRMAVSEQLVNYWREHYHYEKNDHVVIPCTLDRKYFDKETFGISERSLQLKKEMDFSEEDLVLAYSGSTAPWQSFELLEKMFVPLLRSEPRIKILFLSKESKDNARLRDQFPGRVLIKWVEHAQVLDHLACCDYGILVREQSDTNKVASPTKFAEYLYSGLPVLISENLGDFSQFVIEKRCGHIVKETGTDWSFLQKSPLELKTQCFELARECFMKESKSNSASYKKLLDYSH